MGLEWGVLAVAVGLRALLLEMQLRVPQIQVAAAALADIRQITPLLAEKELLLFDGDSNNGLLC
jgi:hypothetical protein